MFFTVLLESVLKLKQGETEKVKKPRGWSFLLNGYSSMKLLILFFCSSRCLRFYLCLPDITTTRQSLLNILLSTSFIKAIGWITLQNKSSLKICSGISLPWSQTLRLEVPPQCPPWPCATSLPHSLVPFVYMPIFIHGPRTTWRNYCTYHLQCSMTKLSNFNISGRKNHLGIESLGDFCQHYQYITPNL